MLKHYLKIYPFDPLFFGTGRPFNRGEASWTESLLLPNPSTLWGAIYSMLLAHKMIPLAEANAPERLQQLHLGQQFLYTQEEGQEQLWTPTPMDVMGEKGGLGKNYVCQLKRLQEPLIGNYQGNPHYQLVPSQQLTRAESLEQTFVRVKLLSEASAYQEQTNKAIENVQPISKFIQTTYKIGIAIDKTTRTARESMLYRVDAAQLKASTCFLVEIALSPTLAAGLPQTGLLKLGGEGKGAYFEVCPQIPDVLKQLQKQTQSYFLDDEHLIRLYCQTPLYAFDEAGKSLLQQLEEEGLAVLTASLGKLKSMGGFALASAKKSTDRHQRQKYSQAPKKMRRVIPAGSIFYLKSKVGALDAAQLKSILTKVLGKQQERGMGQVLCFPCT